MNKQDSKVKFYNFGSEKIDFSKLENLLDLDASKPIVVSKGFNKALKTVIEKDIKLLQRKVKEIVKEITKIMVINNVSMKKLDDNIENIDNLIASIEILISDMIISKGNYKVGLFSLNKKEKKRKQSSLDQTLNALTNYQNEIVAIKNEYNKLKDRKSTLNDFVEEKTEEEKIDPLERTINFYLNKQRKD